MDGKNEHPAEMVIFGYLSDAGIKSAQRGSAVVINEKRTWTYYLPLYRAKDKEPETMFGLKLVVDGNMPADEIRLLSGDSVRRFSAAAATLESMGYTHRGGTHWRPPLGKAPNFDLIDELRAEVARLTAELDRKP